MSQPFDVVNAINYKNDLDEDFVNENYNAYLINRQFSHFMDTVIIANEINKYPDCSKYNQYLYYYNSVRKGKRFAKWHKNKKDKYLELVKEYYGYSHDRAAEALSLLSNDQLEYIRKKLDKGGRK